MPSSTPDGVVLYGPRSRANLNLLPRGLSLRDFQRLDPRLGTSGSCILVKSFAFLIALADIRALVLPNKLYLVVSHGIDGEVNVLKQIFSRALDTQPPDAVRSCFSALDEESLESKSQSSHEDATIPFELVALASILEAVMGLDNPPELTEIKDRYYSIIGKDFAVFQREAEERGRSRARGLEDLQLAWSRAQRFSRKISQLRTVMKDTLDNDVEMALMFLSKVCRHPQRYLEEPESKWQWEHEEVEHILSYYLQCLQRVKEQAKLLKENLKRERDNYALRVDTARNRLLRIQIYFTVITAFAAMAAVPAGIGGMSEFDSLQFTTVFWVATALILSLPVLGSAVVLTVAEFRGWLLT